MKKLICVFVALLTCLLLATAVSAETTVPTYCQACDAEVTDWQTAPSTFAGLAGGHYHFYLEKNVTYYWLTPGKDADAVTVCLDLNGYHNTMGGRVLGVYNGHTVNIMDSSAEQTGYMEGKKGTNNLSGGAIFNLGALNLYSGTLKFNTAGVTDHSTYSGGVIAQYSYSSAVFNMYGGRIEGGQLVANSSGVSRGAAIYATSGEINLYGGDITYGKTASGVDSCIYLNKTDSLVATLTLSGDVNVDEIKPNSSSAYVNIDGTYSGRARVTYASGITLSDGKKLGTGTNTPNITGELFCTNGDGWLIELDGSTLKLATFTPSGEWHYCEHCKEVRRWTAMTSSNYAIPKTTPGEYHYYLSGSSGKYLQLCSGAEICLDLYGNTYAITGRALLPNKGSTLNLMDTQGDGVVHSTGGTNNPRGNVMTVSSGAVCNMYSGTVKFTNDAAAADYRCGVIAVGGTFNMYGGTIEGADLTGHSNSYAGAILMYNSTSVLNLYGGTVTSGKVSKQAPALRFPPQARP